MSDQPSNQTPPALNTDEQELIDVPVNAWREWLTNPWLLVIALLLVLGGFSLFSNSTKTTDAEQTSDTFPMVYMTGVNIREYGITGDLHHQITTEKIVQYQVDPAVASENDYYLLTNPVFTFYEKHPTPWQVTALRGRGLVDGKLMTLMDNVVIQQDSANYGLTTASTAELHVDTVTQIAHTDKPVSMRNPRMKIDAVGMQANLQDNQFEMKSNVKVTYEPH